MQKKIFHVLISKLPIVYCIPSWMFIETNGYTILEMYICNVINIMYLLIGIYSNFVFPTEGCSETRQILINQYILKIRIAKVPIWQCHGNINNNWQIVQWFCEAYHQYTNGKTRIRTMKYTMGKTISLILWNIPIS